MLKAERREQRRNNRLPTLRNEQDEATKRRQRQRARDRRLAVVEKQRREAGDGL
jgi:hypothetical protein